MTRRLLAPIPVITTIAALAFSHEPFYRPELAKHFMSLGIFFLSIRILSNGIRNLLHSRMCGIDGKDHVKCGEDMNVYFYDFCFVLNITCSFLLYK